MNNLKSGNYVVLDLETPNGSNNSISSIAIAIVKDHTIQKIISSLINPEDGFSKFNMRLTGINIKKVANSPTFKEYWPLIKDILSNNLIVGHNITFDLSVLTKTLQRYSLEIPVFTYVCTMRMSIEYIKEVPSHRLSDLCKCFNFEYNEHKADQDCIAAYNLCEYILLNNEVSDSFIQKYKCSTNEMKDEEFTTTQEETDLTNNINKLHGLIKGITADNVVDELEIQKLKEWIDENNVYKDLPGISIIIKTLKDILADGIVDKYEIITLNKLVKPICKHEIYNKYTLGIQILIGLLEGISCDKEINISELKYLKKWLNDYDFLEGSYPYDIILKKVKNILKDGRIMKSEEAELTKLFDEIMKPTMDKECEIDLKGKKFCLTGEFIFGSRKMVTNRLIELGGIESKGVTKTIDYLFVGDEGSNDWKFGKNGGDKLSKAMAYQKAGLPIKIIKEENMSNILN